MSDSQGHVEAIELNHKPGSVDQRAEDPNKFPFSAFQFDPVGSTLDLIPPWVLRGTKLAVYPVSADYTILDNDMYSFFPVTTGASTKTINLPTASDNMGRILDFVKVDSGVGYVTIDGEGTEKIGVQANALTFDLYLQGDRLTLMSNGTLWLVLDTNGPELSYVSQSDVSIGSPNSATYYNPASHTITLTPGVWEVSFHAIVRGADSGSTYLMLQTALSTSNSSVSDVDLQADLYVNGFSSGTLLLDSSLQRMKKLIVASDTPYYLIIYCLSSGGGALSSLSTRGASQGSSVIRARRIG